MLPPYVGILVNDKLHCRIPTGKTKHERVDFYVEAGKRFGFTPCFFRIQDVKAGKSHVKAYVKSADGKFVMTTIPSPQVIHNRAIYPGIREFRKLQSWASEGKLLFNRWNRYGKLTIHNLLMTDPAFIPHLPRTCRATPANVKAMMELFDSIIVKPNKSSIGRGVMKLDRTQNGWSLEYPVTLSVRNKAWRTAKFSGSRLPLILRRRLLKGKYIVQQCLPLATYKGRPFDLRVSVQRGAAGEWQVTGYVAKVASKSCFLTNVAQGGKVHRLEDILQEEYPRLKQEKVIKKIYDFALRIASHLENSLPDLADLGLDIGISADGNPMFIECNGKDQRYSFREAGMLDEWKATYENPMAYAKYLLTQCR